jgi:hypothetical protein
VTFAKRDLTKRSISRFFSVRVQSNQFIHCLAVTIVIAALGAQHLIAARIIRTLG